MTNSFLHPYARENGEKFIAFVTANDPVHISAIDIEGEAVGGIGLHPQADIQCKNAELGYWLAESFWGKGIIKEAIKQITVVGFKTFDITRIFARPFGTNTASQKALEKAGFTLEARSDSYRIEKTFFKNGIFEDELVYGIR